MFHALKPYPLAWSADEAKRFLWWSSSETRTRDPLLANSMPMWLGRCVTWTSVAALATRDRDNAGWLLQVVATDIGHGSEPAIPPIGAAISQGFRMRRRRDGPLCSTARDRLVVTAPARAAGRGPDRRVAPTWPGRATSRRSGALRAALKS